MRLLFEITGTLFIAGLLCAVVATLAYNTAPEGTHNIGLISEKIGLLIVECALLIVLSIGLAASQITRFLARPQEIEKQESRRAKKEEADSKRIAVLEEREMIAEIQLENIMNPKLPEPEKTASGEGVFDSIIAGEISAKPPIVNSPPPRSRLR